MHPDVRKLYDERRMFSFTGKPGTGIALDGFAELVSIVVVLALLFTLYACSSTCSNKLHSNICSNESMFEHFFNTLSIS